ncbi:MAG: tolC 2 [Firmicutes bacterium]|nr:tolC 2 [Bacillota bacterium]
MKNKKKVIFSSSIALIVLVFSKLVLAAPMSLTVEDCISLALKNNPSIKEAMVNQKTNYWAVKQAEAGKGFTLDYTHAAERYTTYKSYKAAPNGFLVPAWQYYGVTSFDNSFSFSLPVYSGGSLEGQIEEAKQNSKVADLTLEATKQQLKQSVISDYFSVLEYKNNLAVSQETVANYQKHLMNVQLQYSAGTVAKTDLLSSQVSLADAEASLITAQNNYDLAVATLNNVMGLPLGSELTLKDELTYDKNELTLAGCEQYALQHRPEMAEFQAKIDVAKAGINVAKAGKRPSVTVVAGEDWNDSEFPGTENNNWSVGLTTSWSILDSGLVHSKVKQAEAALDTAKIAADQEQDTVKLEVRQYFLSMREAEKRIETTQVAVSQAQDNLRISEVRYKTGVGTNLDVLDAVLSLKEAKTNYSQALYDYNTSKSSLDKAMGK